MDETIMQLSIHMQDGSITQRLRYVLDFLENHPATPKGIHFSINQKDADLDLQYGGEPGDHIFIPYQDQLFQSKVLNTESWVANEYNFKDLKIFSAEPYTNSAQDFFKNERFGFDVFETLFFHISRYEEVFCPEEKKDEHGMMWEHYHFLVREGIFKNPVVDQVVFAFFEALKLSPKLLISQYSISHDIDVLEKFKNPYRALRSLANRLKRPNRLKSFRDWLTMYRAVIQNNAADPFLNFDKLFIEKSSVNLVEKTVYLMAGGNSKHDNYYSIDEPSFDMLLAIADERGYQIGLHGSYHSFKDKVLLQNEKSRLEQKLGKKMLTSRQHFLNFSFEHTPYILDECGIEEDSSLGFQRLYGFRCGTGHAYRLYGFTNEKPFKFLEKPMIVMDGAWLAESGEDIKKAGDKMNKFCIQNKYHTHIHFNFHNSIFDPLKRDAKELWNWYLNFFSSQNHILK